MLGHSLTSRLPCLLFLLAWGPGLVTSQAGQPGSLLDFSPGALPGCAAQCAPLLAAQSVCTPPQAPVTNDASYQACFCQWPALQTLLTTEVGVCDGICTPDLLPQIRTWFLGRCSSGRVLTVTLTGTDTGAPTPTDAGPAQVSPSEEPVTSPPRSDDERPPGSWWSNHWKWVLMLIIIFLAMVVASVAGVWFKRYRKRKKNSVVAEPVVWGPHQHQHHSRGYAYDAAGPGPQSAAAAAVPAQAQPNMAKVTKPSPLRQSRLRA